MEVGTAQSVNFIILFFFVILVLWAGVTHKHAFYYTTKTDSVVRQKITAKSLSQVQTAYKYKRLHTVGAQCSASHHSYKSNSTRFSVTDN